MNPPNPESIPCLTASVVVPALNAEPYLKALIDALLSQVPRAPLEIIIVDSGSQDETVPIAMSYGPKVRVVTLDRFTHGGSRNLGVQEAAGDVVVFLSQDAIPENTNWLSELLAPYAKGEVAATFSRQVPKPDANPMETYFLRTHFPESEAVYTLKDKNEPLRFYHDVFFSNVSSSARRTALVSHPFNERLIMSEDQEFALDLILAGMSVVYVPSSVVLHSHNYTFRAALGRYFDSVYSLRQIFPRHGPGASVRMGVGYLWGEIREVVLKNPKVLPHYVSHVAAKEIGRAHV